MEQHGQIVLLVRWWRYFEWLVADIRSWKRDCAMWNPPLTNQTFEKTDSKTPSLTWPCPPSGAPWSLRKASRRVRFKVAIHCRGMGLDATYEPLHLRLWVLDLRMGQIQIHCYLRNPLIVWFNLRGTLNLRAESLKSHGGSHSFFSPFSILREWGRGNFLLELRMTHSSLNLL